MADKSFYEEFLRDTPSEKDTPPNPQSQDEPTPKDNGWGSWNEEKPKAAPSGMRKKLRPQDFDPSVLAQQIPFSTDSAKVASKFPTAAHVEAFCEESPNTNFVPPSFTGLDLGEDLDKLRRGTAYKQAEFPERDDSQNEDGTNPFAAEEQEVPTTEKEGNVEDGMTWEDCGVHPKVAAGLRSLSKKDPLPSQVPLLKAALVEKDDVVLTNAHGTGKTEAAIIAAVCEAMPKQRRVFSGEAPKTEPPHVTSGGATVDPQENAVEYRGTMMPKVLLLAPTRELCVQTADAARKLVVASGLNLSVRSIYGGTPNITCNRLTGYPVIDIMVACVGRLHDILTKKRVSFDALRMTCIDEVHQLLNGLDLSATRVARKERFMEKQRSEESGEPVQPDPAETTDDEKVSRIFLEIRLRAETSRAIVTAPKLDNENLRSLQKELVGNSPVLFRWTAFEASAVNTELYFISTKAPTASFGEKFGQLKEQWEKSMLSLPDERAVAVMNIITRIRGANKDTPGTGRLFPFLIICSTRKECDRLDADLNRVMPTKVANKIGVCHSGIGQQEREWRCRAFNEGIEIDILITTPHIGVTGLNWACLPTVISLSEPFNTSEDRQQLWQHKVSRTGRVGHSGLAFTIIDPDLDVDKELIIGIVPFLQSEGRDMPSFVEDIFNAHIKEVEQKNRDAEAKQGEGTSDGNSEWAGYQEPKPDDADRSWAKEQEEASREADEDAGTSGWGAPEEDADDENKLSDELPPQPDTIKDSDTVVDYYREIGVSRYATRDQIRLRLKALLLQWHPDKNPDNIAEAEQRTALLNRAREVLMDEDLRADYDTSNLTAGL